MNTYFRRLFLLIALAILCAYCGGGNVPSGWSQGPESIVVEICPAKASVPDLGRRAMLAAADRFHRLKFGVHSVDTRSLVVNSGYREYRGVITAWRFQIEGEGKGRLTLAKTSPEYTKIGFLRVEDLASRLARGIGRHSCLAITELEKRAAAAGVVIPRALPEVVKIEPLREAVPVSDTTVQEQATVSASEESTGSPIDSADAGTPAL